MKNIINLFCSAALMIMLTACATQKKEISPEKKHIASLTEEILDKKLIKGKSTQEEVKLMFGEPLSSDVLDSKTSKYVYTAVESKAKGEYIPFVSYVTYDNKMVTLSILFENKIVVNYDLLIKNKESPRNLSYYNTL